MRRGAREPAPEPSMSYAMRVERGTTGGVRRQRERPVKGVWGKTGEIGMKAIVGKDGRTKDEFSRNDKLKKSAMKVKGDCEGRNATGRLIG